MRRQSNVFSKLDPRPRQGRPRSALAVLVPFAAALSLGCGGPSPTETRAPTASGEEMFELCTSCHGPEGHGNPELNAPAIAGLEQWYIQSQLNKFRSGARGTHPGDITGMAMRPMAMSLWNDGDIATISAYVAALPPGQPVATLDGDPAKGKALYAPCTACHGPDASGNEQLKAPSLNHANDWYLVRQLKKFKDGVRGTNPKDIEGGQMRPMAMALPNEQAMKDVVAHIMTLK